MALAVVSDDNESGPAIRADAESLAAHWQYNWQTGTSSCAGSLRDDDG